MKNIIVDIVFIAGTAGLAWSIGEMVSWWMSLFIGSACAVSFSVLLAKSKEHDTK